MYLVSLNHFLIRIPIISAIMFENMTFARAHLALRLAMQRWGEPPCHEQVRGSTAPTFHLFPRLPYEIRIQIWHLSVILSSPRVIELRQSPKSGRGRRFSPTARVGTHLKPPAALSVCHESREAVESRYILHTEHVNLFLNPEVDVLYIGEHTSVKCLRDLIFYSPREELGRVKRLVVQRDKLGILSENVVGLDSYPGRGCKPVYHHFTGLEELFVAYADPLLCPCHEQTPRNDVCSRCRDKGQRINDCLFGWRLTTYGEFVETQGGGHYYEAILRAPANILLGNCANTSGRRPRYVWSKSRKACVSVYD